MASALETIRSHHEDIERLEEEMLTLVRMIPGNVCEHVLLLRKLLVWCLC